MIEKKLGECTEIFRCPIARKPIGEGSVVCRDVSRDCFCGLTSFVDVRRSQQVSVNVTKRGQKYFLCANDILLTHVGAVERIGEVGLVREIDEFALPGRSLCTIRAKTVNPVWLFYWLKQSKEKIANIVTPLPQKARPLSSVVLNMENLKNLLIPLPTQAEIDGIGAAHSKILQKCATIADESNGIKEEQSNMLFWLRKN